MSTTLATAVGGRVADLGLAGPLAGCCAPAATGCAPSSRRTPRHAEPSGPTLGGGCRSGTGTPRRAEARRSSAAMLRGKTARARRDQRRRVVTRTLKACVRAELRVDCCSPPGGEPVPAHVSVTLLLNATYEPLCVVSSRRAVVLVLTEKAVPVEDGDGAFHSVTTAVRIPAVVRLTRYVRVPYRAQVPLTRRAVFARDGGRCVYCGAAATSLDHVVPRSRGGAAQPGTTWSPPARAATTPRPTARSASWAGACGRRREPRPGRPGGCSDSAPRIPDGRPTWTTAKPRPPDPDARSYDDGASLFEALR